VGKLAIIGGLSVFSVVNGKFLLVPQARVDVLVEVE